MKKAAKAKKAATPRDEAARASRLARLKEAVRLRKAARDKENAERVKGEIARVKARAREQSEAQATRAKAMKMAPKFAAELAKQTRPVSRKQYLFALNALDLTVASEKTAEVLGVSKRQSMRLASGKAVVAPALKERIVQYLQHGY